jgi:hypothetical protein
MGDTEEVDAFPVLADEPRVVRVASTAGALSSGRRSGLAAVPTVQAAAVAAGGFVAGAAVVGFVGRRRARPRRRSSGRGSGEVSRGAELLQIVGSRSLLVDVHLLGGRD